MGCGSGGSSTSTVYYTVKFETNGGSEIADIKVESGKTITAPEDPTKDGFIFGGWYKDEALTEVFYFSEKITSNLTLYALWVDSDTAVADYALSEIIIGYQGTDNANYVTENLTLQTKINSADILWESDSSAISSNGTVTRQAANVDVTLTARASYNGKTSDSRTFKLRVIKKRTRINSEIQPLTIDTAKSGDIEVTRNDSGDITDIEGEYVSFDIENADDALDAVTVLRNELGIKNPMEEIKAAVITSDTAGAEYQFIQIYNGVKVFGRAIMVSSNSKNESDFLHSTLLSSDVISKADGKADIGQETAETNAKAAYTGDVKVDSAKTEKIIFSFGDYETDPIYAYIVRVYGTTDDGYVDENVLICAIDGTVLGSSSNIYFATKQYEELNEIDEEPVKFYVLLNPDATKVFMANDGSPKVEVHSGDKNNILTRLNGEAWNDAKAVSAYTNTLKVMECWENSFDRNSIDGNGMTVKVVINPTILPATRDNAGWIKSEEAFYVFDKQTLPYSTAAALDIMMHEITHGVLDYSTPVKPSSMVHEGYADIFGCIIDQNWLMGEILWNPCNRNVANPDKGVMPGPSYMSESSNYGSDGHIQSLLVSHVAYLMHQDYDAANGLTWEELGKVWYKSMSMGLYTSWVILNFEIRKDWDHADFDDVQRCVVSAAKELINAGELPQNKLAVIEAAFEKVLNGTNSTTPTPSPTPTPVTPFVPVTGDIAIDAEHFPDEVFRNAISTYYDKNSDGVLSEAERNAVTLLYLHEMNISSLQGIEYFTELQVLSCRANKLTSLNVNNCRKLRELYCSENQITDLQFGACTALVNLGCGSNPLKKLTDVVNCKNLEMLLCPGNQLTELNLTNCTALTVLTCPENQITTLDLSKCPGLNSENVYCDDGVTITWASTVTGDIAIDAEHFPDETFRQCVSGNFDTNGDGVLSSSEIENVTNIDVGNKDMNISSLQGIEYFTALTFLNCTSNQLSELNVSSNTDLKELHCGGNHLAELDVTKNINLVELQCDGNNLTDLDITKNTNLVTLYCRCNQLEKLDASKNLVLKYLNCDTNNIANLRLGNNTALEILNCYENQLTNLDVSGCIALTAMNCHENQITELNLINCPNIRILCDGGITITWSDGTTTTTTSRGNFSHSSVSVSSTGTNADGAKNKNHASVGSHSTAGLIVLASIPVFTAEQTGEMSFNIAIDKINKEIPENSKLFLLNESEDLRGDFIIDGENMKVAANFESGKTYNLIVAAEEIENEKVTGSGGGCVSHAGSSAGSAGLGLFGLLIFAVLKKIKS